MHIGDNMGTFWLNMYDLRKARTTILYVWLVLSIRSSLEYASLTQGRASQSCLRPICIAFCINALSNQAIKINQDSIHPHLQLNLGSFPVSSEVPKWIKPRHKKPGMRIKSSFSSSKRRFHAATPAWRNSWRDRRTAVGYQSILPQHG